MALDEIISLGGFQVFAGHFGNQLIESDFGRPAKFFTRFCGVTEECFDFGGAEVPLVNSDNW